MLLADSLRLVVGFRAQFRQAFVEVGFQLAQNLSNGLVHGIYYDGLELLANGGFHKVKSSVGAFYYS